MAIKQEEIKADRKKWKKKNHLGNEKLNYKLCWEDYI